MLVIPRWYRAALESLPESSVPKYWRPFIIQGTERTPLRARHTKCSRYGVIRRFFPFRTRTNPFSQIRRTYSYTRRLPADIMCHRSAVDNVCLPPLEGVCANSLCGACLALAEEIPPFCDSNVKVRWKASFAVPLAFPRSMCRQELVVSFIFQAFYLFPV